MDAHPRVAVGDQRPLVVLPVALGARGEPDGLQAGGAARAQEALVARELVAARAAERLEERGVGLALPEAVGEQDRAARLDRGGQPLECGCEAAERMRGAEAA